MTAQELYALVFVIVPGVAIGAATWYWRFSLHHHRKKRSRGAAVVRFFRGGALFGNLRLCSGSPSGFRQMTTTFGKYQLMADLQIFNATNSAAVRSTNQTFGSALGRPTATLDPRIVRLSAQFKF